VATGFVLWFTGLSGSGKTTLARLSAQAVVERGLHAELLDADAVRAEHWPELGFTRADRGLNVRRLGFVASLVERCGACAVVSAISPYREDRAKIRLSVQHFVEVYVCCPLETLIARDRKGLYQRALAGELRHFTGISDPYEPPETPELELHTQLESVEDSLTRIVEYLEGARLIRREGSAR
jgi:adenylyl-sulfate kinase